MYTDATGLRAGYFNQSRSFATLQANVTRNRVLAGRRGAHPRRYHAYGKRFILRGARIERQRDQHQQRAN